MRILFFDTNTQHAREVHAKMLSYRGIPWDLQHFGSFDDANQALTNDSFDVVLLSLRGDESVEGNFSQFLRACQNHAVVALLEDERFGDAKQWLPLGISDCIANDSLTGEYLIRRLRMAIARQDRRTPEMQVVVNRQLYSRSLANGSPAEIESKESFESTRMRTNDEEATRLSIAILKDRGTPRLLDETSEAFEVTVFRDLQDYALKVRQEPGSIDCIIVEQDLYEREGASAFQIAELKFPGPPVLLLSSDRSDAAAVTHIEDGFDDCILAKSCTTSGLLRAIEQSIGRFHYGVKLVEESIRNAPKVSERRERPRSGADRRTGARYLLTRPLLAIPVLQDGTPDRAGIRDAFSVDFASGGIGFQISNHAGIPSRNWILGVECDVEDGLGERFHFSNVLVRNISYPQGGVRMGTQFQSAEFDLLQPENLMPTLCSQTGRFRNRLSDRALEQWMEIGVLHKRLLHRIQTCPECKAVASNGRGCRECGSPEIHFHELIHHYACAHVGRAEDFQREDGLACPKCLQHSLVAGVDFELIHSQYECNQCRFEGSQLAEVGTCLQCRLRFPSHLAIEEEVYGYDVDRLDVLALLNAAG